MASWSLTPSVTRSERHIPREVEINIFSERANGSLARVPLRKIVLDVWGMLQRPSVKAILCMARVRRVHRQSVERSVAGQDGGERT